MNDLDESGSIVIENCKNIDRAEISIEPGKLNIKYAPNGTGKSAIADGIRTANTGNQTLESALTPFKYRDNPDTHPFAVYGLEGFSSVEVFDSNYVDNVAFIANGILANSFEVFVKTPEYDQTIQNIETLLIDVRKSVSSDSVINMISALNLLIANVGGNSGLTSSNALRGNSPAKRGLANGNLRKSIPSEHQGFSRYIGSDRLGKWAKWYASATGWLEAEDDCCPFCGQDISEMHDVINGVRERYSSSGADNLDKVLSGISVADDYFSDEARINLCEILDSPQSITDAQSSYLAEVVQQATLIAECIQRSNDLASYFKLSAAGENIDRLIQQCRVDTSLLAHFNSPSCNEAIEAYNKAIDAVDVESRKLFGIVNAQKAKLAQSISEHQDEINAFFKSAGYPYTVRIDLSSQGECSVKLVHESSYVVDDANGVLSYGERNALSLVFFMYSALSSNPDLIILDDPITSFDGHKRFAILHMLFLKDADTPSSLKNKTVLLLTHEFEIVYDIEHTLKQEFQPLAKTTLLHISNGMITETVIGKSDMKPVKKLFEELSKESKPLLVRLAYARRLLELDDLKNGAWDVLSSLFHHRSEPISAKGEILPNSAIQNAEAWISETIGFEFDYQDALSHLADGNYVLESFHSCTCNYEKLQIARIALDGVEDRVTKKLLDETLHVDIGFTYQLDPRRFELISNTVIEQCQEALERRYGK